MTQRSNHEIDAESKKLRLVFLEKYSNYVFKKKLFEGVLAKMEA